MDKPIIFSKHAEDKLLLLHQHGFELSKREIEEVMRSPIRIRTGYIGRKIADGIISEKHMVRIIFEDLPRQIKIITMYPARRDRYEN